MSTPVSAPGSAEAAPSTTVATTTAIAESQEGWSPFLCESPFASMFRAFFAYLIVMSGILVVSSQPFENTTAASYMRVAGLISAIAFAVAYDPTRFGKILRGMKFGPG